MLQNVTVELKFAGCRGVEPLWTKSFAYISRWIPAPDRRRTRPRAEESGEAAEVYRQLLNPETRASGKGRWVKRGVLGLTAVGIAGWALRRKPPTS